MATRSELREKIMTILYQIDLYKKNNIDYDIDNVIKESTTEKVQTEIEAGSEKAAEHTYIINTNTGKFHEPSCRSVQRMNDSNKKEYIGSRDDLITQGYEPCKICNP